MMNIFVYGIPILLFGLGAYYGEKAVLAAMDKFRATRQIVEEAEKVGRATWLPVVQWYKTRDNQIRIFFLNEGTLSSAVFDQSYVVFRHGDTSGILFTRLTYGNDGNLSDYGYCATLVAPDIAPESKPEFAPDVQAAVAAIMQPRQQPVSDQPISIETADTATCLRMLDALVDPENLNVETVGQASAILARLAKIVGDVPEVTGAIEYLATLLSQFQSNQDILAIKEALDRMRQRIEERAHTVSATVEVNGIRPTPNRAPRA
jgi:hypothetical protein